MSTTPQVRSLVIAQDFPWPCGSGSMLRLAAVINALGQLGPVELFSTVLDLRDLPIELPSDSPVVRSKVSHYPPAALGAAVRAQWLMSRHTLEIAAQRFENPRRELAEWARGPYDVVWVSKATTYVGLGRPQLGPTIVDLDDLEDRKILARLDGPVFASLYPDTWPGRAHAALAGMQARLNARRWARLQRDIAASVDAVIVCSDLDARRLGVANSVVVPNGYDEPAAPAGRPGVNPSPTVLLQGVLHYPPNADAAAWLATEIAPQLQELEPRARVRLVGADSPPQRALHRPPLVTVTGRVPEIVPELARADVVAVPVRFGSGTRVKILEAFAHRIPVVSTTLGAEGIAALDGEHLLLADTAESFAAACARLFQDTELRRRLTDNAFDLFTERYQWSAAGRTVTGLACRLAGVPQCKPADQRSP